MMLSCEYLIDVHYESTVDVCLGCFQTGAHITNCQVLVK